MDEEFFLNCGVLPSFQFEQPPLSFTMQELNSLNSPASDFFFFDSATSPSARNSQYVPESVMIRELMGKLGNISSSAPPPPAMTTTPVQYDRAGKSCYGTTTLGSPHKIITIPIIDHFTSIGNPIPLPAMPGELAERAAAMARVSFSSGGSSQSFNGRTNQFRVNDGITLPRISCSRPCINAANSAQLEVVNQSKLVENPDQGGRSELADSTGNSSLSGRNPGEGTGFKNDGKEDFGSRKRKVVPKGKVKELAPSTPPSSNKVAGNGDEDGNAKKTTSSEWDGEQGGNVNEEEDKENASKKQCSSGNQKQIEPPKDYIHVRARRGQATDSHSLAERVRREKISERMKLLQDLVPGCNKVTGKALMLDEIINYVQSLQKQVEFLSMKLATVNPKMEFNVDTHFTNKIPQPSCSLQQQTYQLDSSSSRVYCGHQPLQNHTSTNVARCSIDPLHDVTLNHDNGIIQSPLIDGLHDVSQLPSSFEGDLQTIIDLGFVQSSQGDAAI